MKRPPKSPPWARLVILAGPSGDAQSSRADTCRELSNGQAGRREGLQEEVMLGCSLEKWEDGNMEGVKQAAGSLSSPRKGRLDFRLELERSPTGWRSGQRFAW